MERCPWRQTGHSVTSIEKGVRERGQSALSRLHGAAKKGSDPFPGAFPIVTAIVQRDLGPAVVAAVQVAAQGRGAALGNGAQRLILHRTQAVRRPVGVAVGTDDRTQAQRRPAGHRGLVRAHTPGRLLDVVEQVEPRGRGGQVRARQVQVLHRGADLAMPEQTLEGRQVGAVLHRVGTDQYTLIIFYTYERHQL